MSDSPEAIEEENFLCFCERECGLTPKADAKCTVIQHCSEAFDNVVTAANRFVNCIRLGRMGKSPEDEFCVI